MCCLDSNENLEKQIHTLYNKLISFQILKEVNLGQLCSFQEGYVNPPQGKKEYFDGKIKWLRAVDINESFIINTSRTLTDVGFKSAKKSAILFEPYTLAISKSGTIGRLGIIGDYMCGNRAVINIKPKEKILLPFIYSFLKKSYEQLLILAVGTVQKNLYVSLLESLIIKLPSDRELINFCKKTFNYMELMYNNSLQNKQLADLRDTLLPRLMSGELDVSNIELKFKSNSHFSKYFLKNLFAISLKILYNKMHSTFTQYARRFLI